MVGEVLKRASKPRSVQLIVATYIVVLLISFVFLKDYQFLQFIIPPGAVARYVTIVGISYMLFRQIHYVVDVSQGQIEQTSLWVYLNYQLDLFTLYAGPIQRYQQFEECWMSLSPASHVQP